METIRINNADVQCAVSSADIESLQSVAVSAVEKLENGTGEGNDFLGWLHLPSETTDALLDDITAMAEKLHKTYE